MAKSLLFTVRELKCVLPLAEVVETCRPLPLERFEGTHGFVLGACVVRGEPVPVVSAARLLTGGDSTPGRFVVVRVGDRRAVLAVDAVLGIREWPEVEFAAFPSLLQPAPAAEVAAIGALDHELLVRLRSARLVPPEVWRHLEGERGA